MTALDLLIVVVFVISVVYGLWRGVLVQLASVGGILAGIVACRVLTPLLAGWLASDEPNPQGDYVDTVVINLAVLLSAYFGVRFLARALNNLVRILRLKPLDRIAGAIFSLFEWMLGLSLLLNLANVVLPKADIPHRSKLSDGRALTAVMDLAPDILGGINITELLGLDGGEDAGNDTPADNIRADKVVKSE